MTLSAHSAGAVATAAITIPVLGFAVGPIFEEHDQRWQPVGAASSRSRVPVAQS